MKNTLRLLVLAAAPIAMSATTTARSQETGFYVKMDLGGNLTQNTDFKEFFGPVAPGSKVKFDPGFRAGLAGGYLFTEWFSTEAEIGFMGNEIHSITGFAVHDATFSNVPFLVNAKFQLPNRSPITPYIGAGVGFSEAILDADFIGTREEGGFFGVEGSEADAVFAYQGFAGLRYRINDQMGVSVEYRYFATEAPSWGEDEFFGGSIQFGRTQTHAISLAFDVRF